MTAETMAEVLAAHWSVSTHTDRKPSVDKCDGCGAVIYTWGGATGGSEALAAHQAAALSAAGFGPVRAARAEKACICPRFTDTGGYRIADLTCSTHGVNGTDPGDWQE